MFTNPPLNIESFATMEPALQILAISGVILLVLGAYAAVMYNTWVKLRNRWQNAFGQIDVQLKRRHELIPNLVEVVKGYMAHERETLEKVIAARGQAVAAGDQARAKPGEPALMESLKEAEGSLVFALGRLFAVAEAYPDLKANQNMLSLQEELRSTENRLAFARQAYNDAVMVYNIRVQSFPDTILASSFGFKPAALYQIEAEEERATPKVAFGK
jgi:LemA protein